LVIFSFNYSLLIHNEGKYWVDARNRRRVFQQFSIEHNFDPLVPENWYTTNIKQFKTFKVAFPTSPLPLFILLHKKDAKQVLSYYKRDLGKALEHLFPNVGIDRSKFAYLGQTKIKKAE